MEAKRRNYFLLLNMVESQKIRKYTDTLKEVLIERIWKSKGYLKFILFRTHTHTLSLCMCVLINFFFLWLHNTFSELT